MRHIHSISGLGLCLLLLVAPAGRSQEFTLTDEYAPRRIETPSPWIVEADYLMWWTRNAQVPALVSTSDPGATRDQAGVLGDPLTSVLLGDHGIDGGRRSGARLSLTRQLHTLESTSFHASGFYVGDDRGSGTFSATSLGTPILARPFLNAQTLQEDSELVAFPGVLEGTVAMESFSELHGAEIGLRQALTQHPGGSSFLTAGYRFLRYRDSLTIREDLRSIDTGGVVPLNTEFLVHDQFGASSQFHGGNIGFGFQTDQETWGASLLTSLAIGGLTRSLTIAGQTEVTVPGQVTNTTAGGLLAQPTNAGSYRSPRLVAIPELHAKIHRRLNDYMTLDFGYDLLVVPHVWRSAEQMDRVVNDSQIGGQPLFGAPRPRHDERSQSLWIQGISFGLTTVW